MSCLSTHTGICWIAPHVPTIATVARPIASTG
jgi:hypothetical protein